MKTLKIIQCIGDAALLLASIFNLINQITEKNIFSLAITLPLLLIAVVGIVCGIVIIVKNRQNK